MVEGIFLIDAENLTRKFGDLTEADNVTFHIDEGAVLAFFTGGNLIYYGAQSRKQLSMDGTPS